jgi:uncharacterized protein YbbK (DUF523 family)/uncharacterized protein YbgA (DUF1722 family)
MNRAANGTIKIGVSACLTGQEVRYDGGHKLDPLVSGLLAERFDLVPVCPEVEIGMGTPRETIQLTGDPVRPALVATQTGRDWTAEMNEWSRDRSLALAGDEVCGFVFKKNSPSCGLVAVPVIQDDGLPLLVGRGLFAAAFARTHPLTPLEDESRLAEPRIRDHFLERVYAYDRLVRAFAGSWENEAIVEFHRREKMLLMSHSPKRCVELDRLIEGIADFRPSAFREQYRTAYMETMAVRPTVRGHLETLGTIADHLSGRLTPDQQRHLIELLEDFRAERISLKAPAELLAQYVELHAVSEVSDQVYLDPHWLAG